MTAGLCGCAATGGISALQGAGQIPATAAGLFGVPAETVSIQVGAEIGQITTIAAQLQMLRAQLDGTLPVLAVPPIINPSPTPVVGTPITPTMPAPGGPLPTAPTSNG